MSKTGDTSHEEPAMSPRNVPQPGLRPLMRRPQFHFACFAAVLALCSAPLAVAGPNKDWPSYNRTLTSERYSPLSAIDAGNVDRLDIACTYDTGQMTSFQTGLIEVSGLIYGTTEQDTFAIDADTCAE